MLGTFKTFFKKKEIDPNSDSDSDSEFYEHEPSSNPNFLTDQKKIQSLLKEIEQASPLCTITFEGSTEKFSSSILDIQLDNKQIILDELLPAHGNSLLKKTTKLKLSTLHKGIHLAFKLEHMTSGSSRGITYYKTEIPDRVFYPQRRTSPRIQITSMSIPFSGISERTQVSIGGLVYDLSRGGVGVSCPNNIARFQRGDLLKNCRITIDDQTINFDLAVRFVKTSSGTRKTLVGGYFENIPSKSKNKIERFVAAIEREEIRNRKQQSSDFMLE